MLVRSGGRPCSAACQIKHTRLLLVSAQLQDICTVYTADKEKECYAVSFKFTPYSVTIFLFTTVMQILFLVQRHPSHCAHLTTEPGIANEKKEDISRGGASSPLHTTPPPLPTPWKILKVETNLICVLWGILEANLKKSSTLKFMMNISFVPSICIHRSIILIFKVEKECLLIFFSTENIFSVIFDFQFRKNPCFRDEFQALNK